MTVRFREQVEGAIRATVILSPTVFSWFGAPSPELTPKIRQVLTLETARMYLVHALQAQLYEDFYCRGFAQPTTRKGLDWLPGQTPFTEALVGANCGTGYWSQGWEVRAIDERELLVHKGSLDLVVRPDECAPDIDGPVVRGTLLSVRFPKDLPAVSPGFYMALGGAELTPDNSGGLVRWYWNLAPDSAIQFLNHATSSLQRAQLAYTIKILDDPVRFSRYDSVVLYHRKEDSTEVSEILEGTYASLGSDPRRGVPALTKPLAPGVGLAEDPGGGESFGLHRCAILAEQIILAHEQGKSTIADRMTVVEEGFAKLGINLFSRPYLNFGSSDDYGFTTNRTRPRDALTKSAVRHEVLNSSQLLDVACSIGDGLNQDAVWYEGRCNWMGFEPDPRHSSNNFVRMAYKALGPEMYAGTSGVAYFLAQLYEVVGDLKSRESATGALRQALSHVDEVSVPMRFGFYSGWAGIAYAATRIGMIVGDDKFVNQAKQLLQRLERENLEGCEPDVLSGLAGTILALIALQDTLDVDFVITFASRLGDKLLESGVNSEGGTSWTSVSVPNQLNLTGFSHGASGVGLAMLKLSDVTGDSKYRDITARAFKYERHWFDEDQANWPDLRTTSPQGRADSVPLPFSASWCHGAPGIALARLGALGYGESNVTKAEALIALETTRRAIESHLKADTGNFSLCHGLAGNADILLHGFEALGRKHETYLHVAHQVALVGIDKYSGVGRQWPCGTKGTTPSLMLGLAGIGYFYLRMANPGIPSVLMQPS